MDSHRFAAITVLVFALSMFCESQEMWSQEANIKYPHMAPVEEYLMKDWAAEIALARSAAPKSISRDATVLVLGRHGYQIAVEGKNGFVCIVERSWMLAYDDSEFWNPSVRLPLCQNPPVARSHLPRTFKTTELALAGRSEREMFESIKAAFDQKELPMPEPGSMCYMMSKQRNFGPKFGHADPHLMFCFPQPDHVAWGRMCLTPRWTCINTLQTLQPITEFTVSVAKCSDGTVARGNQR